VFYLGHSLTNFDIPAMVEDVAVDLGHTNTWAAKIGIGAGLKFQYDNPSGGQGWPDDPMNVITYLGANAFDAVVITEAQPIADQVAVNDPVLYGGNFYDLAVGENPSCQVYLYEHWGSRTTAGSDAAWRTGLTSELTYWQGIANGINATRSGTPDILILPGGQAMAALYDALAAAQVPGYTDIGDFFVDDIHLTDPGNYFMACVHFASIYRRSPVGATAITDDRFASPHTPPAAESVAALQQLAWDTVQTWFANGGL
jgi:hypothetical protein